MSRLFVIFLSGLAVGRAAFLLEPLWTSSNDLMPYSISHPFLPDLEMSLLEAHSGMRHQKCQKKASGRTHEKRTPSHTEPAPTNLSPTPAPTGKSSPSTTVHIKDEKDFAILLPGSPEELVSDAESNGISFCTSGSTDSSCTRRMQNGFITAAAVSRAEDGSWIQVTGCMDTSKSSLSPSDDGGQFDVRYPNGAQCTFGGYAASFIEQVEPSSNRFCLRCCKDSNDQHNCNSHQDTAGCVTAVPGTYDFPDLGVSCS